MWGLNRLELIRKQDRVRRCEEMLLDGCSRFQIAAALGVSVASVLVYFKDIYKRNRDEDPKVFEEKRFIFVRRQEELARKAIASFERSRNDAVTVTTDYKPTQCELCSGSGMVEEEKWCKVCNGDGVVLQEVVTRTVKGQAGDSSLLRVASDCFKEAAKIQGLYPEKGEKHEHVHFHQDQNAFAEAPSDLLVDALSAIRRLEASVNGRKKENKEVGEDDTVVDVDSSDG